MKTAIYPGSFDPVTLGHLDIIERAAGLFDKLIVCVMVNSEKRYLFDAEKRVELIGRITSHIGNVEVVQSDKLLVDFAEQQGACVIVKGLRAISDYDIEFQMALINKKINPRLETVFLAASQKYMFLSSSATKEMARYGADLSGFLPEAIIEDVRKQMSK